MDTPSRPIPVALLGATGSVGQRFALDLLEHPWFELVSVAASEDSAGELYGDRVHWIQSQPLPPALARLRLETCRVDLPGQIAFSALDSSAAGVVESEFRAAGWFVLTNASNHRLDKDVPLIVPEVNGGALELVESRTAGTGAIVANPNCTTIALTLALAPLAGQFGVKRVHVVSLQALSGAGLGGPTGNETLGNVLPFIEGEEAKLEQETVKILGELSVSAACTRVPVLDGHTLCVSVELERQASRSELIEAWRSFQSEPQERRLPSAPAHPTLYLDDENAPQPRLHADLENGMATSIGRLRECPHYGWKFVAVGHNTLRGAARGSILLAELCLARGIDLQIGE